MAREHVFTELVVAGKSIQGTLIGPDPYIRYGDDGYSYLGPSRVAHLRFRPDSTDERRYVGPGWYVVKYDDSQIKFRLPVSREEDARAVAEHFGMEFGHDDGNFWGSPAHLALLEWSKEHPRVAKRDAPRSIYLKGWDCGTDG